jgi:hypothetical protein
MFVTEHKLRPKKKINKIDKNVEVVFAARLRCHKKFLKYFNGIFKHVTELELEGDNSDREGVDVRIIIIPIALRVSEIDVFEAIKITCSTKYPYIVVLARENNIYKRMCTIDFEYALVISPSRYKLEKGYFYKEKDNKGEYSYPNGVYTLMYYDSENGPYSMYERNRLALKTMMDCLDNKVRTSWGSIDLLGVDDTFYRLNKYSIDRDRKEIL